MDSSKSVSFKKQEHRLDLEKWGPGKVNLLDYRTRKPYELGDKKLLVLSWNIERGYKLEQIINKLKAIDADILCLQELDVFNERSNNTNQFEILCQELELNGCFVTEFVEHKSPKRSALQQGGGIHGNAILSKFDLTCEAFRHEHQPYNWDNDGDKLGEPRNGGRYILSAKIKVWDSVPAILAFNTHFECFTGVKGRLGQLSDLAALSYENKESYPYQLVFGDMNTFGHSLARLSPLFCTDHYRLSSIFYHEPEFWYKFVFRNTDSNIGTSLNSDISLRSKFSHWYDPFDPIKDYTISNHAGFMKAKVDWTFVSGFSVLSKQMLNNSFKASDHKLLVLSLELDSAGTTTESNQLLVDANFDLTQTRFLRRVGITSAVLLGVGAFFTRKYWT